MEGTGRSSPPGLPAKLRLSLVLFLPEFMNQGVVQYTIWAVATLLQFLVLVALIKKNLRREFPLFLWYTVAHLVESIVAFVISLTSAWGYFYVYWGWEAIDAIFTLIVIQSVFIRIFDSYEALRGLGLVVFRWATIVLCIFAVVSAAYAPGNDTARLMNGVLVMERSIELVQVGLLLCLFLFSRLFGLAWRHYIYGIILGFGVSASVGLISAALRTQLGPKYHSALGWLISGAYGLGIFTWLCYLASRRAVEVSAKPPSSAQLREWNEALAGILRR